MTNAWNKRTEMSERLSKLEDQMKNTATPEEVKAIQSEVDALRKEYDESFSAAAAAMCATPPTPPRHVFTPLTNTHRGGN